MLSEVKLTFLNVLLLIFIALKLTGFITWSWLWVMSPLWIPLTIWLMIILMFLIFGDNKRF